MSLNQSWSGFLSTPCDAEVHLWRAPLDLAGHEFATLGRCLSPVEAVRAGRFRNERDRARWTVARAWLRHLLGRYLGVRPTDLEFGQQDRGKPILFDPLGRGLNFSLSHSDDMVVFAVTRGREVGVDIERVGDDFPIAETSSRFLSVSEQEVLAGLPPNLRLRGYYEHWTRKEAYLKGIGLGLTAPEVHFDATSGWSVYGFDVGCDYVAAVAIEGAAHAPAAAIPLQLLVGRAHSGVEYPRAAFQVIKVTAAGGQCSAGSPAAASDRPDPTAAEQP